MALMLELLYALSPILILYCLEVLKSHFYGTTLALYLCRIRFFRIDSLNRKQIENFDVVELDYQYPQINKSKPIKFSQFSALPFFFLDVNFDGEDELIMNYARQGQRYSNAYVAYGLQYWDGESTGYDYLYDSTRGIAPFAV